jgi:hypothetical protein
MRSTDAAARLPTPSLLRTALAVAILVLLPPVWAAESPRRNFDLPAGTAAETLKQFSEQAGVRLHFSVSSAPK